ncbi:hypothetical protein NLO413_0466 [Candidatus Neoehrlichia lotoris str. RAC413]|uniref:Uncharacterized protein n=1 Tax=Candidatus Neoehrlichia procyonis str. RAC413 TaxID=1359163 RepID=A0A0F3NM39_9RICK|nr:hypothetical protein NLO413_0466 [Candidatus Neoehrlichia lotoris str. RAC413]
MNLKKYGVAYYKMNINCIHLNFLKVLFLAWTITIDWRKIIG